MADGIGMSSQLRSWRRLKDALLERIPKKDERAQLHVLLDHILLYLQRVFLGAAEIPGPQIENHPLFNGQNQPLSYELGVELEYRLHRLVSFRLVSRKRIEKLLTVGLLPPTPFSLTRRQTEYFLTHQKNLGIGSLALADSLGISPRTLKREQQQLFTNYGIRVAAKLDPQRFALAQFGISFRAKTTESAQDFDTWIRTKAWNTKQLPFLLGCGWDVNFQDGFLTIYSPNQTHWTKHIQRLLERVQDHFFESLTRHRIRGCYSNINFDYYDHGARQWRIQSDVQTEGLAHFIKQHGDQFTPLQGFDYSQESISFNQADWLLALTLSEGLLTKKERTHLLFQYGFQLAEKTAWTHERRLKLANTLFPAMTFSNLTFEDIICVTAECDEALLPTLHQLISQYAMSRLHPTDKGVVIFIAVPVGGASLMKQLTRTLLNISGIDVVSVLRLKRDIPQTPRLMTHTLWDENAQRWKDPPKE